LWLAVSVMLYHFGAPAGVQALAGGVAVRCFFVLSGYVIALVLDERYRGRTALYLKLRLLRIYPTYLVVLALTTFAWGVVWFHWHLSRGPVAFWAENPPGLLGGAGLVLQHFVLLGAEWFPRFKLGGQPALLYIMIPQAWTLGTELSFYLAAPWLLRASSRALCATVVITLLMKAFIDDSSLYWGAPLLPFEMGYFSLGILGWRWQKGRSLDPARLKLALLLSGALFVALPYATSDMHSLYVLAPVIVAWALPALHHLGQDWALDRQAGEVSYVLYLLHPVTGLMTAMAIKGIPLWPRTFILVLSSLAASVALWWLVEKPVTRLRRRLSAS
jgi:peptidoglycan/LPS O-acetylase OafA/YrhL